MPRKSDWAKQFGASRRAKDKAYCEAAERILEEEDEAKAELDAALIQLKLAREQSDLDNERRRELERLTGKNIRTM